MSSYFSRLLQFLRFPFSVQWRTLIVRAPWLVPLPILYLTSPGGPQPTIIYLPSRDEHQIPVYVFLPPIDDDRELNALFPVHLDFHGGGFVMGSCLEQAPFCALLARRTGRIVLSVDYRMGPFYQFPAAIEDGEDVLTAVMDVKADTRAGFHLRGQIGHLYSQKQPSFEFTNLDPTRLSLSGFSSGGNLALNLTLSVNSPEVPWPSRLPLTGPPVSVLLFYPSFDSRILAHQRPRPSKLPAIGWFGKALSGLSSTYLPAHRRAHPRASPGLADLQDGLHPRARILLILPELDSLAQQSEVWIAKMRDEGKDEQLNVVRVPDMRHGWTQFPEFILSRDEKQMRLQVLNRSLRFMKMHDQKMQSESTRSADIHG